MYFLHEDLLECGSYYSFKNRYAVMKTHNFGGRRVQLVHSYQRLDELADILKGFSYRVFKEDCLDLPDKVYVKREVELSKEQKDAYATMKSAALALLKGKVATLAKHTCLLYTSPSPRDRTRSRMPSSA